MKKTTFTLIILLFTCSISRAQTNASKTSSKKNHKRAYVSKKETTPKTNIQNTPPVKTYNKLTDGYWNYQLEKTDYFDGSTGSIVTYTINVTVDGEYYNNYKYWLYTDDQTGNTFVQLSFYGSSRYLTNNPKAFLEEKLKSYLENHYKASNFNF